MRSSKLNTALQIATILGVAFALKYHYSNATVNGLRWILEPTRLLVETVTSRTFRFEPFAGYLSDDRTFLIAASCSGVNFLIISFLLLTLGKIWRAWPRNIDWRFLPVAMFVAYLTTLVANTIRIVAALATQHLETSWLDRDELHRVEGIVVYFGFLLLLFWASEGRKMDGEQVHWGSDAIGSRSKYLLIIYYLVTLGIPLVRGSYCEPEFWHHALFVILVPLILIVPFALVSRIRDRYATRWAAARLR